VARVNLITWPAFVSIVFWAQRHQLRTQCWSQRDDCYRYHLVNFWRFSGHSMHVRYALSFLCLVGIPFKRAPVDCNSLQQFTLCMPSSPIFLNPGHFVTFSTVSWAILFESLLLYRIIIPTSNPDGYACTCKVNRYQYIFFWFLSVDVMQVQEPPDSWTSIELCWARNGHVCWMPGILIALVDPFRNWVGAICKSFVSPVADAPPLPWGYK